MDNKKVITAKQIEYKIPMYNVYPTNDLEEHLLNSTCKCKPKVVIENGEIILVHNSFDKREIIEELLQYFNKDESKE